MTDSIRQTMRDAHAAALANNYPHRVFPAYRDHSRRAKHRGIDFDFTIEEWWQWWQTDDRWERRGGQPYGLVMARFNDEGPYNPSNVYCTTGWENLRDRDLKIIEPRRPIPAHCMQTFTLRLSRTERAAIDVAAKAAERTPSGFVRKVLADWLRKQEKRA